MFKAEDVMTKNVVSAKGTTSVDEVMEMLVNYKITGIPIVDDDNSLVGIVSEKDLLKLLFTVRNETETPENNPSEEETMEVISETELLDIIYNNTGINDNIENYMSTNIVSFNATDSLAGIAACLIENHFRRVPILENGKLVGIISRRDIIAHIREQKKIIREKSNESNF